MHVFWLGVIVLGWFTQGGLLWAESPPEIHPPRDSASLPSQEQPQPQTKPAAPLGLDQRPNQARLPHFLNPQPGLKNPVPQQHALPQLLTLREALERCTQYNPQGLASQENIQQATALMAQTQGALYPQLSLELQQQRLSGLAPSSTEPLNVFDARLAAGAGILDANKWAFYYQAQQGLTVAQSEHKVQMQVLLHQTAAYFFAYFHQKALLEAMEAILIRDQKLVEQIRQLYTSGVGLKSDVTRAEASLQANLALKIQLQNQLRATELQFKTLLAAPAQDPLHLKPFPLPNYPWLVPPKPGEYALRADYQAGQAQLRQKELVWQAAGWQRFPKGMISASAGTRKETAWSTGKGRKNWGLGFSVSLPIFEGGQIRAQKMQAYSQVRAQRYRQQDLTAQIYQQQTLSIERLEAAVAVMAYREKAFEFQNERLQEAQVRVQSGQADPQRLLDAQADWAQSHQKVIEARYQHALAQLDYARAFGGVEQILRFPSLSPEGPLPAPSAALNTRLAADAAAPPAAPFLAEATRPTAGIGLAGTGSESAPAAEPLSPSAAFPLPESATAQRSEP